MAKSIRSKRMRKLRAFKRIRYGEKELERLQKMLSNAAAEEQTQKEEAEETKQAIEASQMEIDTLTSEEKAKTINAKYPCWMSHFKIRKLAKQERRRKRKEEKRLKKQRKVLTKNHKKSNKRVLLAS